MTEKRIILLRKSNFALKIPKTNNIKNPTFFLKFSFITRLFSTLDVLRIITTSQFCQFFIFFTILQQKINEKTLSTHMRKN